MDSVFPTPDVVEALKQVIKKHAGRKKFADEIGLDPTRLNYFTRWLHPDKYLKSGAAIGNEYWQKVYPFLKEYLPKDFSPTYVDADDVAVPKTQKTAHPVQQLQNAMMQLVPNAQHIIAGIINVHGVPNDRIASVINSAPFLKEEEKRYLIYEIFKGGGE